MMSADERRHPHTKRYLKRLASRVIASRRRRHSGDDGSHERAYSRVIRFGSPGPDIGMSPGDLPEGEV